jgi:hypothetical protein
MFHADWLVHITIHNTLLYSCTDHDMEFYLRFLWLYMIMTNFIGLNLEKYFVKVKLMSFHFSDIGHANFLSKLSSYYNALMTVK